MISCWRLRIRIDSSSDGKQKGCDWHISAFYCIHIYISSHDTNNSNFFETSISGLSRLESHSRAETWVPVVTIDVPSRTTLVTNTTSITIAPSIPCTDIGRPYEAHSLPTPRKCNVQLPSMSSNRARRPWDTPSSSHGLCAPIRSLTPLKEKGEGTLGTRSPARRVSTLAGAGWARQRKKPDRQARQANRFDSRGHLSASVSFRGREECY